MARGFVRYIVVGSSEIPSDVHPAPRTFGRLTHSSFKCFGERQSGHRCFRGHSSRGSFIMSRRNFGLVRAFALLLHTVPDDVPIAGKPYCFFHDLSPGTSEIKQFAVDEPNRISSSGAIAEFW